MNTPTLDLGSLLTGLVGGQRPLDPRDLEGVHDPAQLSLLQQLLALQEQLHSLRSEGLSLESIIENQRLESVGMLAGGIAHDFNNLLMGVLGNASLALLQLEGSHPARPTVRRIERSAQRASELTRQILALSGRGRFLVRPIQTTQLVAELVELLKVSISGRVELQLALAEDLPPVSADATQLQQLLVNLVSNASDALQDRPGTITVTTELVHADTALLRGAALPHPLEPGPVVKLEVSDTGQGMDTETRARMFDPFFTTRPGHQGIGLAAIQGIVRGHGGALLVSTSPGDGTTVAVLLAPCPPGEEERSLPPVTEGSLPGEGTVLVIDDEPIVRVFARESLEIVGYEVLEAEHGEEGIGILERDPSAVDLVLLDLTMPGLSGSETFAGLRRIRPDLKVLLSSGYSEEDAAQRFRGGRPAGFLQKPYRALDLVERVQELMWRG